MIVRIVPGRDAGRATLEPTVPFEMESTTDLDRVPGQESPGLGSPCQLKFTIQRHFDDNRRR
jgi:hypothetical protein